MLPLQGLGQGAQPIMSYNYGAKNTERVKGTFLLLLKASLTYSIILWGLVMLFLKCLLVFLLQIQLLLYLQRRLFVFTWQLCLCLEFRFPARWHLTLLEKHFFYCCCCYEKICTFNSFDLYHASYFYNRSDHGCLYGGTCC